MGSVIQIIKVQRPSDLPDSSVLVIPDELLKLDDGQEVYAFANSGGGVTITTSADGAVEAKVKDENPTGIWPPDAAAMARAAW
ncbi:MAG: hypothetical protein LBL67_03195 [Coriobacteriales bacterium]|jgi:hypothetical protein|nr:hypothetical protein [Coriobacteriales bacterium]